MPSTTPLEPRSCWTDRQPGRWPFDNDGLLSLGALNFVQTTALNGSFTQNASGTNGVDLDLSTSLADRLNLTGVATVAGNITVNLVDPANTVAKAKPGKKDITIISADGGETHAGINLVAPNTAVMTYSLTYPNFKDINLSYVLDYAPSD